MSLFNFNQEEMLTFFAVLVRYSILFSVLPFVGDRYVPMPVKILLSLAVTVALFPALVASGRVRPGEAQAWGATAGGIAGVITLEAVFALILGFTARLAFDAVNFGGNLVGNFMGFAFASTFDPHQASQTQVVAEIQMALAMLLFLVLDGHHLMLRTSLQSYGVLGLGGSGMPAQWYSAAFGQRLIELSGQVVKFGIQLAAPVSVVLFGVNVAFGVLSKAMPQLNVLVLSMAVSALVGLAVMFLSLGEFQAVTGELFARMEDWMNSVMRVMATGK